MYIYCLRFDVLGPGTLVDRPAGAHAATSYAYADDLENSVYLKCARKSVPLRRQPRPQRDITVPSFT